MPDPQKIEHIEEPYVKATMMAPNDYVGAIMELVSINAVILSIWNTWMKIG